MYQLVHKQNLFLPHMKLLIARISIGMNGFCLWNLSPQDVNEITQTRSRNVSNLILSPSQRTLDFVPRSLLNRVRGALWWARHIGWLRRSWRAKPTDPKSTSGPWASWPSRWWKENRHTSMRIHWGYVGVIDSPTSCSRFNFNCRFESVDNATMHCDLQRLKSQTLSSSGTLPDCHQRDSRVAESWKVVAHLPRLPKSLSGNGCGKEGWKQRAFAGKPVSNY